MRIVMYTKDPCPYCDRAKRLLSNHGLSWEEIDLTHRPDEMQKIKNDWGWKTVPIIIIDGKLIGGYDDLKQLPQFKVD